MTARAEGQCGQRETESRPRVGDLGNGPVTLGDHEAETLSGFHAEEVKAAATHDIIT